MISILCPSRGRPNNVHRLVSSALSSSSVPLEFIFYFDEDDTTINSALSGLQVKHVVGPRIVLSKMWNRCYEEASNDIVMHCGDDIVFRSPGWDSLVLEAFDRYEDKIILVYGRDGIQDQGLGTHSFIHRNWVNTVGYFVPPYFSSDYNDTWLNDVAEALGRRVYIPEIYTEHMHFVAGKGPIDKTHAERLARHSADRVEDLYISKASEREADVVKLRNFIESFK